MLHVEQHDTVALVRMEHGKANAFDIDLSIGLRDELSAQTTGLVDEVTSDDLLIHRALEVAAKLAAVPARSFEVAKAMLRKPTLDRIRLLPPAADGDVANAWRLPESQAAIRAHLQKAIRREHS